jgi:small subunit ribosomal protein S6
METAVKKKLYEAMFLIDSAQASDWDKVIATLETVLQKADSEIVSMRKWDDRKLAYEIEGKSRGTYILCYFRADGRKVQEIERAVQLSEQIMRVLILSAETMSKEDIEKDTPAMKADRQKDKPGKKAEAEQASKEKQVEEAVEMVD